MIFQLIIVPVAALVALFTALFLYIWIKKQDAGGAQVRRIAGYIREGAFAYLKQQYKTSGIFFIVTFVLLLIFSFGFRVLSVYVPFMFLTGAFFSGLSGFFGMLTSTMTSSRTTHSASHSLNRALKISFRGGSEKDARPGINRNYCAGDNRITTRTDCDHWLIVGQFTARFFLCDFYG